ncbi:MAG: GldG family protein, partial [Oscillospiraceae bacterium]
MKKNVFNKRRFKHGSLATIMTIGLIIVVVLVNIVASMLAERFPVNIDLTANKIYELSQDSIDYVKKLDQPITVEVLAEEESFVSRGEYYKQANEIFKKYNMYSKNITLKYTDPYTNPDALSKYPKENLNVGDVIVSAGERYRALGGLDLFNVDTEQGVITSSKAENAITNAIMLVTDANPTTVTVLTGYKSGSVSGLTDLLQSNGYLVTETNIMTTAIDPNVQIAILPAPVVDLTAESLKKIDAYLDNDGQYGKNLYYFADVSQPELPRVEEFLSEWGMALGKGMVIETNDQKIMGNQSFVMQNYKDSSIAKGLPLTEEKE